MHFNSLPFAIFLPVVFALYWFLSGRKLVYQNLLLLIASYFFYSCWDWRFVFLLAFSTFLDFISGLQIHRSSTRSQQRTWLIISVVINLALLGFFKYYNFFVDSFAALLQQFGFTPHHSTLNIILPVGISFYTFHGLSYVFDIYNRKIAPTGNWINYALFVSFFPLLVAGPIERATHLLPQVEKAREFSYAKSVDGLRQILWGLFKKMVIADSCAGYVDMIFNDHAAWSGSTLALGAVLFAFQIYADFSGYSDIALGTARLFGFELLQNFKFPYFSRDIAEFWRRWHVSLSSWFRDYLYIPLGGSRGGNWMRIRNTLIIFLVSGFWHGANFTFIVWGSLHALFILPSILFRTNREHLEIVAPGKNLPSFREASAIAITFASTVFAWIFFRAADLDTAIQYISGIFSRSLFRLPEPDTYSKGLLFLIAVFMLVEWLGRENKYAIEKAGLIRARPVRWLFYSAITLTILSYGLKNSEAPHEFIYFQF